ncbi:esterase/lipase family protein [Gordonia sp. SL306]|uniref:esterase/lipase family protein n=1 Tax=Gordonia sp. SL306 TaxID=2995145 RepID=UPI00226F5865|nr:lipase [Gordonia sp. SL306]WAC57599.1 lipase [Gordonia sp. SL306]
MRALVSIWLTALALVLATGPATAVPSLGPAGAQLPVPNNYFAGTFNQLADPDGDPPGTNDWSCKPSARHPNPVVLVHGGFANRQLDWGVYGPVLHNAGYCTFALNWGVQAGVPKPFSGIAGLSSIEAVGVPELSAFVRKVLATTHASKVDLVSHSLGSLVTGYFIRYGGGHTVVDKSVSIAGIYQGVAIPQEVIDASPLTRGGNCALCREPAAGSAFIKKLNAGGTPYVPGVEYTNIATRYDEMAVPYTSGLVPGKPGQQVTNIVVQDSCAQDYSEHQAIAGSHRTTVMVRNALDPEHPQRVPCELVLPSVGSTPGR